MSTENPVVKESFTPQVPQAGDLLDGSVRPFDTVAEVFDHLMRERGFRVARGTYQHGNGDTLPTWVIDRPDEPAWNGVWHIWEPEPEYPEDSEAQVLMELCGTAIEKWNGEAYVFAPNVPSHLPRTVGASDAGSEATKHPA